MRNHLLTTGGFLRGNQCGKSLYLNSKYPELEITQRGRSKESGLKRKLAATLTRHIFPHGKFSGVDAAGSIEAATVHTKKLIEDNTETIFNASFFSEGIFCIVDIFHNTKGYWKAFSLKHKEDSFDEIILAGSLHYQILKKCRIDIKDYMMIEYDSKTDGNGKINLDYSVSSVKEQISFMQDFVTKKIGELRHLLDRDMIPVINTGDHCIKPHPCEYHEYCEYSGNGK